MDNVEYLFAAYTLVWAVFFAYLFSLHRRLDRLQKQARRLFEEGGEEER